MTRSRASAKKAGSAFERLIADHFANVIDDRIDRRVKTGAADKGDIVNVRTADGGRVVIECKDVARTDLAGWLREAHTEAANDGTDLGVVIFKRRGTRNPADQYVLMDVATLTRLIKKEQ